MPSSCSRLSCRMLDGDVVKLLVASRATLSDMPERHKVRLLQDLFKLHIIRRELNVRN